MNQEEFETLLRQIKKLRIVDERKIIGHRLRQGCRHRFTKWDRDHLRDYIIKATKRLQFAVQIMEESK